MNCLAHAIRFLDRDPFFVAGTSVPDWLGMVDRRNRIRRERAAEFVDSSSCNLSQLANGICQHHHDDAWFHHSAAFNERLIEFTVELRDLLNGDPKFRPQFVAHIVIEMLLDAALADGDDQPLESYYRTIAQLDPAALQTELNRMTGRASQSIELFLPRFLLDRYMFDYRTDEGIAYRVNRILRRVKLEPMPDAFAQWTGSARQRIDLTAFDLLSAQSPDSAGQVRD